MADGCCCCSLSLVALMAAIDRLMQRHVNGDQCDNVDADSCNESSSSSGINKDRCDGWNKRWECWAGDLCWVDMRV